MNTKNIKSNIRKLIPSRLNQSTFGTHESHFKTPPTGISNPNHHDIGGTSVLSLDKLSGGSTGSQMDEGLEDYDMGTTMDDLEVGGGPDGGKPVRAAWGSKLQYLLTIVGYAVGLGNIWRFPYLCQQNGGGAFLIPYFIMLFAEGIPLFYLELGIGQKIRKGSIGVWNEINPLLGGLGIASIMVSFIIGLYYNVIIAWCIYYIAVSLRKTLPWSKCPTVLTYVPEILLQTGATIMNAITTPNTATMVDSTIEEATNSYQDTFTRIRDEIVNNLTRSVSSITSTYSDGVTSPTPTLINFMKTTSLVGLLVTSSGLNNVSDPETWMSSISTTSPITPSYYGNSQGSNLLSALNATHPILAHALLTNNISLFYGELSKVSPNFNRDGRVRRGRQIYRKNNFRTEPEGDVFNEEELESRYENLPIVYESIDERKAIQDLSKYSSRAVQKPVLECQLSSSTQHFWYRNTLNISSGIDVVDSFNWKIMICLLIAWIVVYLCIMKGIKSSGKAAYFTATFPYAVLIIIFGRAVTLRGAGLGLKHMFYPKTEKLADPQVWLDAATQIFYSLGLAFGSIIAFSSYNPPHNDCRKDAIVVSFINCFTSIFASLVIFSVLGFKALSNYESCIKINQETIYEYYKGAINRTLIKADYTNYLTRLNTTKANLDFIRCDLNENLNQAAEGTGLAFIVFTQAILEFPAPPFWSIIFFSMLITLGLGTMFGMMESILTSIHDLHLFPWLRKEILAAFICGISFICGLIFCLSSGEYWLKLFDTFGGTLSLVIIAFFEVIAVIYVYGHARFTHDLEVMTGNRPGWYWQITWRFVSPILMAVIFLASVIKWIVKRPTYNSYDIKRAKLITTPYPGWVLGAVAFLILLGSIWIPLIAIIRYFRIVKLEPDIILNAKRLRNTDSTSKIISSTSTLNKLDDADADLNGGIPAVGSKPSLETIKEVS